MNLFIRIAHIAATLRRGFGSYIPHMIALAGLGFLGGMLEGVGINAVIPLFSLIVGQATGVKDAITVAIEQGFAFVHLPFRVGYVLAFIATLFVLKTALQVVGSYIQLRIVADYEERTRNRLFEKMLGAQWPFLVREKLGHLQTTLMTNVSIASSLLSHIGLVLMIASALLVYVTVAFAISPSITLITLGLAAFLFFSFRSFLPRVRQLAQHTQAMNKTIAHHVDETVMGMKAVKSFGVGLAVATRARDYFRQFKINQLTASFLTIIAGAVLQPVSLVLICVVFAISYRLPSFNFAALLAVVYLIKQIFSYVESLQKKFFSMQSSFPALEDLLRYEDAATAAEDVACGTRPLLFAHELRFTDVSFSYRSDIPVLRRVSFVVPKGAMIGLIGPSGAGKTTISDLLLRLLAPQSGTITVDGVPVSDIAITDWRRRVGYVSQDIFLLNDTIAANIRFYDASISDNDVRAAAAAANLDEFIAQLPEGLHTIVGERGVLLSGGQRQRLSIARALVRNPELLILDEATSALDNESETRIQDVIARLKGRVTVLAIAHRLSTIMAADSVIVLDRGTIIETGTSQQLLQDARSYFYKTYHLKDQAQLH